MSKFTHEQLAEALSPNGLRVRERGLTAWEYVSEESVGECGRDATSWRPRCSGS